jgi:hypothetical protein
MLKPVQHDWSNRHSSKWKLFKLSGFSNGSWNVRHIQ